MSLRVCLSYMFSVLCILKPTTATPLSSPPSLNSPPPTNTTPPTTLNASIEDFAVSPVWNGTLLPPLACTTTSIFALLDLALQDITSTTATNTYQTSAFPNLAITLTPPQNQSVRWATWGIASAIKTMLATDRYETATFTLLYRNRTVGTATYSTPETVAAPITKPQVEAESGPFGTTENEISVTPFHRNDGAAAPVIYTFDGPAATNNNNIAVNGTRLTLQVTFSSVEIKLEEYVGAVVDALVALAGEGAGERVERWGMVYAGGVEISFSAVRRGGRPDLEVGFLGRALGLLVQVSMQGGVGREVDVGVLVGGVVVGYGRVRRRERGEVGGGWSVANVSLGG